MNRCIHCLIPDTRPDTAFVDGVCSACLSYHKRPQIDWDARKRQLEDILTKSANGSAYDCVVPSSGGKDSTWQVLQLIKLGAKPLIVTATTCYLTPIGRRNIDNLGRYATTIEVTPNRDQRAKLNRLGLEMVGDPSWPEHVSIFTTPFRIAQAMGIPLIFYGENPQNQYGGPPGTEEALTMTRRWRSEFGGFLGLRPSDLAPMAGDMTDYEMLPEDPDRPVTAYFLGQFLEWDSARNLREAMAAGMESIKPCYANWWPGENLDNAMTGLHDHIMYRKYGYGRGAAQISVDIRQGIITRDSALKWVEIWDGSFPYSYADVRFERVLDRIGVTQGQLDHWLHYYANKDLFGAEKSRRPILKEFC